MKLTALNLASHPHERVRTARHVAWTLVASLIVASAAHGGLAWWLHGRQPTQPSGGAAIDRATVDGWVAEVDDLVGAAQRLRSRNITVSVELADQIVAWRTIPWNALFADLEALLPDRVRLEAVVPQTVGAAEVRIRMTAAAQDTGPLQNLLLALQQHEAFGEVYPQSESSDDDGLTRMILQARYEPADAPRAAGGVGEGRGDER